jgi:hypothetical protein
MEIFHGELDKEVNIMESIRIPEALNKLGGKLNLTILPGVGMRYVRKFSKAINYINGLKIIQGSVSAASVIYGT